MSITIHYHGTLDDIQQVESMEDRLIDLAFSLGGRATLWRSFASHDPARIIRGLFIQLEPGQEPLSLLVSPEGHLTPLHEVKQAENEPFTEPPYCFIKSQFGSLHGHIAIIHLLDAIQQRFCSNLVVHDESEYFQHRDLQRLEQQRQKLQSLLDTIADAFEADGLSPEAAEDPDILATRLERIAALIHQKVHADPTPIPLTNTDSHSQESTDSSTLEDELDSNGRIQRQNDRRLERMTRRIAEATAAGLSTHEAFDQAIQEEGLPIPPSQTTNPPPLIDSTTPSTTPSTTHQHPAIDQAQAFYLQISHLPDRLSHPSLFASVLAKASLDMLGGILQATHQDLATPASRALAITQLKRALSAHAYARGAIFGMRSEKAIDETLATNLWDQLRSLLNTIHHLSENAWNEPHHDSP